MVEYKRRVRLRSSENIGNFFPRKLCKENLSPFGRVCVALFGIDKPGQALAERLGRTDESTVRLANLYIKGKTPPSYEALMVVLDELRPRKRA